jgi:hypothetical protein
MAAPALPVIPNPQSANLPNPYHFAPDPSSQRASTIGGNASTNAGGIHTLKDFVSSNHVLGFEMVLPDGEVIEVGGKNGSYEGGSFDLPGLICGHEGRSASSRSCGCAWCPRHVVPHDRGVVRDHGRRVQHGQRR